MRTPSMFRFIQAFKDCQIKYTVFKGTYSLKDQIRYCSKAPHHRGEAFQANK